MTTTTTTTMPEETGSGSAPELATFDRYRRDVPTSADANGDDGSGPLVDALGRASAGRTTRMAIRGTSGTGRTRLIERARSAAAERSMRVLATHGRTVDADVPYAALLTLLHPVADRLGELPTVERESLLAAIDLRDADVAVRAARTGLWRLLTRLSEERPLLVAVDDSDQIDAATLDVMSFALGGWTARPSPCWWRWTAGPATRWRPSATSSSCSMAWITRRSWQPCATPCR